MFKNQTTQLFLYDELHAHKINQYPVNPVIIQYIQYIQYFHLSQKPKHITLLQLELLKNSHKSHSLSNNLLTFHTPSPHPDKMKRGTLLHLEFNTHFLKYDGTC